MSDINNCFIIGSHLLHQLGVSITKTSLKKQLLDHRAYPSVLALQDTFASFNIDSIVVGIKTDQLKQIPLPAIGHFQINGQGQFVIFEKVDQDKVWYTDHRNKTKYISFSELSKVWNGVTLLMEVKEPYKEDNYNFKRKKELIEKRVSRYSILSSGILLASLSFFLPAYFNFIFLLNLVGLIFSIAILQRQLGFGSEILDGFCGKGDTKNCDEVINAEESKIFGIYNLSEVAVIYFVGGIISLLALYLIPAVASFSFIIASIACLATFITLYYQWKIVKKWCMLCLGLTAIVWLELALYFPIFESLTISLPGGIVILFAFLVPITVWVNIRERYFQSFEIPKIKRRLNRFLQSEKVFENLLSKKSKAPKLLMPFELQRGNESSPVTITVVSKPSCKYCTATHDEVEKLLNKFRDNLHVKYRFFVEPASRNSVSYNMISRILGLQMSRGNDTAIEALSDWYSVKNAIQINSWEEKYQLSESIDKDLIHDIISRHHEWCVASNVTHTPMIFFNDRPLPEEFSLKDLDYQIRKVIERKKSKF